MAGESPLLDRVRAAAALFDDDALAALANRGLVRRARKDIETAPPTLVGPHEGRLRFRVEDCTVDLAESPAQSQCTCPASGVCRHILTALLFMRLSQSTAPVVPSPVAGDELLAIDDAALRQWAGRALVRRAEESLGRGLRAQFETSGPIVIRFPDWNVTCRWMPGGGLDGMVCSCHSREPCEHRVAGVLAFQIERGRRPLVLASVALEASAGAPRTRVEVLASVGVVLREMLSLGLARLSQATEDRLRTLAVSAHGVDLPRLERALRGLADEVALLLARDAKAATANLLLTAARLEALRTALAGPTPELVGQHKSRYDRVGELELLGVGARQRRTRSGYTGLTVYFWDPQARAWATWTEARPITVANFDPASRYQQDGPWIGCTAPREACRRRLRLQDAWRNSAGRLSGRASTRALLLGATELPASTNAVTQWTELLQPANRLFGGGLGERREQDEIVLLKPKQWGPPLFDPIRQELTRLIFDASARPLPMVLPHTPQTVQAITTLEKHDPATTSAVLGLLRMHESRLIIEPIALHHEKGVTNLTLDGVVVSTPARTETAVAEEEEDELPEEADTVTATTGVGLLLERILGDLEALAESGPLAGTTTAHVRQWQTKADALGLAIVARAMDRLAAELDRVRLGVDAERSPAAEALLRAAYVVQFALTQEALAAATALLPTPLTKGGRERSPDDAKR